MKRNMTVSALILAFFMSLFLSGNAFANTYSFVLGHADEQERDVIKIYDMDSNVQVAMVDLSADPQTVIASPFTADSTESEYITDMVVGRLGTFLYFITENASDSSGQLYRLNIGLYLDSSNADSTAAFSTLTLLTTVGNSPRALVEGPMGYVLYVANYGDDSITKLDMSYQNGIAVATTIDGFYNPVAIAVTNGYDVFVANSDTNAAGNHVVTVYNTYKKEEIEIPNIPTDIITTPDFEYVYVCNSDPGSGSGFISVIKPEDYFDFDDDGDDIVDADENTVVDSIAIDGSVPTKLTYIKGGDTIVAADQAAQILSVIDSSGRINNINEDSGTPLNPTGTAGLSGMFGTPDGSKVYTVSGADETVYVTDIETGLTTTSTDFPADADVFRDIVIHQAPPLPVDGLEADVSLGVITLTWDDKSDNETGFLIYRLDQSDETKEHKYYLLDKIEEASVQIYEDTSVIKGDRYSYRIYPYNEYSRGISTTEITARAKDTSDTKICFISGVTENSNNTLTLLLMLVLSVFSFTLMVERKN